LNALDYYNNPQITAQIEKQVRSIKNRQDVEDCRQEIFAELYDYMPLDSVSAIRLIERVGRKFRRNAQTIAEKEINLEDAGIDD
jgi:hypothetical protein